MTAYTTPVPIRARDHLYAPGTRWICWGSCFALELTRHLAVCGYPVASNPYGICYQPLSMLHQLSLSQSASWSSDEVIQSRGQYRHLRAQRPASAESEEQLLMELAERGDRWIRAIASADHLVLTLGTAWSWYHIERDMTVANCHGLAQQQFERRLLRIETLVETLTQLLGELRSIRPGLSCTLTVSPIRHLRSGIIDNARSKAHLIAAVHALIDEQDDVCYFPAYEILLDELRDYRFYAEDMTHPSPIALRHIMKHWDLSVMTESHSELALEAYKLQRGLAHTPRTADDPEWDIRREEMLRRRTELIKSYHGH